MTDLPDNPVHAGDGAWVLDPCPFCGKEPHFKSAEDDQGPYIWVECFCGVDAFYTTVHGGQYRDKELAATAWNRRAPTALPDGEGGELVNRIRATSDQLRRMVTASEFAGAETGVRVKSPDFLLADLDEAADLIQSLLAQVQKVEEIEENRKALRGLLEYSEDSIARLERKWKFQLERADTAEATIATLQKQLETAREALETIATDPAAQELWTAKAARRALSAINTQEGKDG